MRFSHIFGSRLTVLEMINCLLVSGLRSAEAGERRYVREEPTCHYMATPVTATVVWAGGTFDIDAGDNLGVVPYGLSTASFMIFISVIQAAMNRIS